MHNVVGKRWVIFWCAISVYPARARVRWHSSMALMYHCLDSVGVNSLPAGVMQSRMSTHQFLVAETSIRIPQRARRQLKPARYQQPSPIREYTWTAYKEPHRCGKKRPIHGATISRQHKLPPDHSSDMRQQQRQAILLTALPVAQRQL